MQAVCSTSASTFKGLALPRRAPRTGAWPLQLELLIVSSSSAWAGLNVLNIHAGVAAARPVLSGEQPTPGQAAKDPRWTLTLLTRLGFCSAYSNRSHSATARRSILWLMAFNVRLEHWQGFVFRQQYRL